MKDEFTRQWIIENALQEMKNYGYGVLTLRGLHYRLVSRGMTNSQNHYKRVIKAMTEARWDGLVDFDFFVDNDRDVIGRTKYEETIVEDKIEEAQEAIKAWMTHYYRNRWENQPHYVEVFIEKKALQGVFQDICYSKGVALAPCKGYPSLTFLYESAQRMKKADETGKQCTILYFGDYDPSGEDIPRSIAENMERLIGDRIVSVKRVALMEHQVIDWSLPPAPVKSGDSRSASWDGLGQVELDAVEPNQLKGLCEDAIDEMFNRSLYEDLKEVEQGERVIYIRELKKFVNGMQD